MNILDLSHAFQIADDVANERVRAFYHSHEDVLAAIARLRSHLKQSTAPLAPEYYNACVEGIACLLAWVGETSTAIH